jgi:hypothetical protein
MTEVRAANDDGRHDDVRSASVLLFRAALAMTTLLDHDVAPVMYVAVAQFFPPLAEGKTEEEADLIAESIYAAFDELRSRDLSDAEFKRFVRSEEGWRWLAIQSLWAFGLEEADAKALVEAAPHLPERLREILLENDETRELQQRVDVALGERNPSRARRLLHELEERVGRLMHERHDGPADK